MTTRARPATTIARPLAAGRRAAVGAIAGAGLLASLVLLAPSAAGAAPSGGPPWSSSPAAGTAGTAVTATSGTGGACAVDAVDARGAVVHLVGTEIDLWLTTADPAARPRVTFLLATAPVAADGSWSVTATVPAGAGLAPGPYHLDATCIVEGASGRSTYPIVASNVFTILPSTAPPSPPAPPGPPAPPPPATPPTPVVHPPPAAPAATTRVLDATATRATAGALATTGATSLPLAAAGAALLLLGLALTRAGRRPARPARTGS